MKNLAFTVVLALTAIAGLAQTQAPPVGTDQPASQKVIKDPTEYNAYVTALGMQDQAQKAAAMEAFVKQYPQSVMLTDALIEARTAYQKAGNQVKVEETARRILQLLPNDITSLAVVAYLDHGRGAAGNAEALKQSCTESQNGLEQLKTWKKPEGMSDSDFETARKGTEDIFDGAAGFCAVKANDYAKARDFLTKAVQVDATNVQDVYWLAVADLEMNPLDLNGFWYGAKAMNLAANDPNSLKTISKYVQGRYKKYHGKSDDWDKFAALAVSQSSPPADLATLIPPAPTPCEMAVNVLKENKPEELSFGDREYILSRANCSPANKEAADKVWKSIQDMEKAGQARLEIPVKLIAASKNSLDAAIDEDNQTANKPDLHVELEKPLLKVPTPGTMTKITGVITKYTPDPFMFTMEQGALPKPAPSPKRPVHRAALQ